MTAADLIAQTLERMHFDGTGCGDPKSPGACSNCYGPSPMTAREVAQAVTDALGLVEERVPFTEVHVVKGSVSEDVHCTRTRYVTPWTKEQTDDRR